MWKELYKIFTLSAIVLTSTVVFCACAGKKNNNAITDKIDKVHNSYTGITFNSDSAYNIIKKQLEFGPRVPGTEGHKRMSDWLEDQITVYADTVLVQTTEAMAFNGDKLPIRNIFARMNPKSKERILLIAHYDTRPWADQESDVSLRNKPIPGANDGASGVAVLLELARVLKENNTEKGVDFLFVDAEDYGKPENVSIWDSQNEDSWCLGTQAWIKNSPYDVTTLPKFGILLDMVGGYNARFHREFFSDQFASKAVDAVWSAASHSGYGDRFPNERGGAITDDHVYLNEAGIPTIDIIENNNPDTGSFNPTWHTHADDIGNIDRETLKAVGVTVQNVIMNIELE